MNNGGGGAFATVFLLVIIVLGAGFLFNEEIDNQKQQEIAQQVEIQMAGENQRLESENRALTAENDQLRADNQRLNQELEAANATNSNLVTNLDAANTARNACVGELTNARNENTALNVQIAAVTGERQACTAQLEQRDAANADLTNRVVIRERELEHASARILDLEARLVEIPVSGNCPTEEGNRDATGPALTINQEGLTWPLFSMIGMTLFGVAALVTRPRYGAKTRQAYAAEDDSTTYVKMTRSEARRYAQARRKR